MWEKIPYHDWNDWLDLWEIDTKKIKIDTKWDLYLIKKALDINEKELNKKIENMDYYQSQINSFLEKQKDLKNIDVGDLSSIIYYESLMIFHFNSQIKWNKLIPIDIRKDFEIFIESIINIISQNKKINLK